MLDKPAVAIIICTVVVVIQQQFTLTIAAKYSKPYDDDDDCDIQLVESIPQNLSYPHGAPISQSTYWAWKWLLRNTRKSLDIASFYWILQGRDIGGSYPSDWQGEEIFHDLLNLGSKGPAFVRVVAEYPRSSISDLSNDLELLNNTQFTSVRYTNFESVWGSGILHTKMWLVDQQHAYIGSANMDWRSLTQVKEMGVLIRNCSTLVNDLSKIFEVYWYMGQPGSKLPPQWPSNYSTVYNYTNPMNVSFGNSLSHVYVGSSPAMLCPEGRSTDLQAILQSIRSARKFIYVAVMDFLSLIVTYKKSPKSTFWPVIVDALLASAINNGTEIRLLASNWMHTSPDMYQIVASLKSMDKVMNANIQVKWFTVPSFTPEQQDIPFGRVNHNKYMVTDNVAYIGTSNWSGDYFKYTGGVGFVSSPKIDGSSSLRYHLQSVFLRDWNSQYAKDV